MINFLTKSNQDDCLYLNDALLAHGYFQNGIFEFYGDQKGHNHPEDFLKDFMIQGIKAVEAE